MSELRTTVITVLTIIVILLICTYFVFSTNSPLNGYSDSNDEQVSHTLDKEIGGVGHV